MSLQTAAIILKSDNKFWGLKREVFRYLTNIYLQGDIEEADWDILVEIAATQAPFLTKIQQYVLEYRGEDDEKKVIFIDDYPLFPKSVFNKVTNTPFNHFESEEIVEAFSRAMIYGLIPYIQKLIERIPNTGARQEREIMIQIQK